AAPERPAGGSLLDYAPDADDDSIAEADFRDARLDGDESEIADDLFETHAQDPATTFEAGGMESQSHNDGEPPGLPGAAKSAPDTSILARLPVPLLIHSGD